MQFLPVSSELCARLRRGVLRALHFYVARTVRKKDGVGRGKQASKRERERDRVRKGGEGENKRKREREQDRITKARHCED